MRPRLGRLLADGVTLELATYAFKADGHKYVCRCRTFEVSDTLLGSLEAGGHRRPRWTVSRNKHRALFVFEGTHEDLRNAERFEARAVRSYRRALRARRRLVPAQPSAIVA